MISFKRVCPIGMIGVRVIELHTLLSDLLIENADRIWLLMDRVQKHLLTSATETSRKKRPSSALSDRGLNE
jgi:hypothetical protein